MARWRRELTAPIHRERARHAADLLAFAVALALPWSTSLSAVLIAILALALLVSLDPAAIHKTPITLAGILPLALWLFAALGMLWAEASWAARLDGLRGYHKLLLLPLLLLHFSRSKRGWMVAVAYLSSCTAMLVVSLAFTVWPGLTWHWSTAPGVAVRDWIAQSGEFVLCAFALLVMAIERLRLGRHALAAALAASSALFLFDVFYVATSRTSLVVVPVLAVVLGLRHLRWKGALLAGAALIFVGAIVWASSPYLRDRVLHLDQEIELFLAKPDQVSAGVTSAGERLEYWSKSIDFIRAAPAVGHGTGSLIRLFRQSAIGRSGLAGLAAANPHNQTLAVAVDLGLAGAVLLWAMWLAHLGLFRAPGLVGTFGLFVVAQNAVSCLFNAHLADFVQGWTYVLGVGVLGGMALAQRWAGAERGIGLAADRQAKAGD